MTSHPVFFDFNGTRTRIGAAYADKDGGFVLVLGGTVSIGASEGPARASGASSGGGGGGACFPPFGRAKGQPIHGAAMKDLEFYRMAAERSLNDPSKAKWHEKERTLLAALEAEIARQGGGGYEPPRNDGPVDDADIPF